MGDSILVSEREDPLGTRKDAELYSFLSGGYRKNNDLLEAQAEAKENDAIEYLMRSVKSSADMTPTQGFATALLAAIPTLGGYLIGKQYEIPSTPQGAWAKNFSEYKDMMGNLGASAGMQQGIKAGGLASGGIIESLEKSQALKNKAQQEIASQQLDEAERLRAGQLTNAQASLMQDRQVDLENLRFQHDRELQDLRDRKLELPQEVIDAIQKEQPLPPNVQLTTSQLRAATELKNSIRLQNSLEARIGQSKLPGYENYSDTLPSPATIGKLSEERFGVAKTNQLIDTYLMNPDAYVGQESAVQAAVAGMLVNAQRQATGSGAQFTEMEKKLVTDALPHIAAGDLIGWIKAQALGRNQRQFATTLKGLYEKTFDYAVADAYGQFRTDMPKEYYPLPVRMKYPKYNSGQFGQPTTSALGAPSATGDVGIPKRLPGETLAQWRSRTGL